MSRIIAEASLFFTLKSSSPRIKVFFQLRTKQSIDGYKFLYLEYHRKYLKLFHQNLECSWLGVPSLWQHFRKQHLHRAEISSSIIQRNMIGWNIMVEPVMDFQIWLKLNKFNGKMDLVCNSMLTKLEKLWNLEFQQQILKSIR